MKLATDYIEAVVGGKIDVCEYVKLSMARHVNDLARQRTQAFPYYFDEDAAVKPIKFFMVAKHYKGIFKGKNFVPEPWQAAILWITFGWKRLDGTRKYKYQYIEVPRKNGKSTFISVQALYLLIADGENAPELYFTAMTQAQASIVYKEARKIAEETPQIKSRLTIGAYEIKNPSNGGFMRALGGDSKTQDGLNPSAAALDEYHEHKSDDMFDVIDTAFGMRWQPLMSIITTAGFNKSLPCYRYRDHCIKVLQGVKSQEDLFAVIYTIDEGDDWKDRKNWIKANPSWRIMNQTDFDNQGAQAQGNASKEVPFLTKKLNVWTDAPDVWISDSDWMRCAGNVRHVDLKGVKCYGGADFASTTDLNSLVLNFPLKDGTRHVKAWFWIPEKKVKQKEDHVDYWAWNKQGFISVVGGDAIEHDELAGEIIKVLDFYNVVGISYDKYGIGEAVIQSMIKRGYPISKLHPLKQNTTHMQGAIRMMEGEILLQRINHEGHPVLRWNVGNVVIYLDTYGGIKFDRKRVIEKIDGAVAMAMSIAEEINAAGDAPIKYLPNFV